jgi:hypothetical protein
VFFSITRMFSPNELTPSPYTSKWCFPLSFSLSLRTVNCLELRSETGDSVLSKMQAHRGLPCWRCINLPPLKHKEPKQLSTYSGLATGSKIGRSVIDPCWNKDSTPLQSGHSSSKTQPAVYQIDTTLLSKSKRPGREAEHSRQLTASNGTLRPSHTFLAWCLIMHTENFNVLLIWKLHVGSRN